MPFKTMAIITNCCFYSHEYQRIQTKNPFDEMLSLSFDLGPLKVNNNMSNMSQFCKGLSKGLI
jgi:hypothetical protein